MNLVLNDCNSDEPDEGQNSQNNHRFDEIFHTLMDHYTVDGFPGEIGDKGFAYRKRKINKKLSVHGSVLLMNYSHTPAIRGLPRHLLFISQQ